MMAQPSEREQAIQTLKERLRGLDVAMLTTAEPDGSLRSRPMVVTQADFDGDLWFLSRSQNRLIWSIQRHRRVNVTYTDPAQGRFVSVSGTASILHDTRKAEELWQPLHQGWLDSPDSPDVCVVRIVVESAQAWGGPSGGGTERIEGFSSKA
jgi:general stress protein 26